MSYTKELKALLKESANGYLPMKPNLENAHATHIYAKPAKESRILHRMDNLDNLELSGIGTLEMSEDVLFEGRPTVRLCPPAEFTLPRHVLPKTKLYGDTHIKCKFDHEDWTEYNRLTFWIYPDLPTYENVYFLITLVNDTPEDKVRSGLLEDTLILQLKHGEWNRVVWEIPSAHRNRIVSINLRSSVDGRQAGSDLWKKFYFGPISLDKVEEDFYEGWELNDRIAFSHVGYQPGRTKAAYTQDTDAKEFELLDAESGKVVYTGAVDKMHSNLGDYAVMDFTEYDEPGEYCLKVGEAKTGKFQIDKEAYASSIWKALNFFYQERCGCEVEGIHRLCHLDAYAKHPDGRLISSGGGWHDAGDMSQGLCNTSESAHAMLDLAERVKDSDPALYKRALDEARWGLDWCLKTRFGDGYRARWTRIGTWTNNIYGDMDDLELDAAFDPFENFCGAAAEAAGARLFRDVDPVFADYCLKCAKEDFEFAYQKAFNRGVTAQTIGEGAVAAGELYKVSKDPEVLKKGAILAKHVLDCQQQEYPDWDIPIRGFFYMTDQPDAVPLSYPHRAHEQSPVMGLACMYEAAPNHPDAAKWYRGLELYGEYIKVIRKYTDPYGLLPNAIYRLGRDGQEFKDADAQIKNGIRLSDEYYLRIMPVANDFRGFNGTLLTKAKAVTVTARVTGDDELNQIALRQLEWVLGMNPFAQCTMYGEGYNYPDLFVMFSHQLVGAIPVGIWTYEDNDRPYFPQMNNATYKEVWVHTTSRFLWVLADVYGDVKKIVAKTTESESCEEGKKEEKETVSKVINDLSDADTINFSGVGYIETSKEQLYEGNTTVKLTTPNTINKVDTSFFNYAKEPTMAFAVNQEASEGMNRITLKVYPECAGCNTVFVKISLCKAGEKEAYCVSEYNIKNKKWNTISLDISKIDFSMTDEILVSVPFAGALSNMGALSELYFSTLALEKAEDSSTEILPEKTWQEKAWDRIAELNALRCGRDVPGVHVICHEDCVAVHPDGRTVSVGGGWHDTGKYSHNVCNTAKITLELMDLAKKCSEEEYPLYVALMKEARHGLEWILRTRFEDGYRCVEASIDVWTNGIIGDLDDIKVPAHNDPYANFCAAIAEAESYKVFAESDIVFARYALKSAEADFGFAYERIGMEKALYGMKYEPAEVNLYEKAVEAAEKLYEVTGKSYYKDRMESFAKKLS